jgi:type II secretory pathway predicted ATPase ExeA
MINADRLMNHFNLTQLPFGRAVSEAGLLQHRSFSEAMARLSLALATKTPALFTAEPGLGKLCGRGSQ